MIKKTVFKRAYKTWPKAERDRLDNAINYLNSDGGEGLDLVQDAAQASTAIPEDLLANARAASLEGWAALAKFIKEITEQQRALLEPESLSLKDAARKADEQKKVAQDAVA
jgi:recombination protein RecT